VRERTLETLTAPAVGCRVWLGPLPDLGAALRASGRRRLAKADPEDLPWPCSERRRPLVSLIRGAEDQPVPLQGVDGREGLARVRAERVRPIDGLGLPRRVELEGALDCR